MQSVSQLFGPHIRTLMMAAALLVFAIVVGACGPRTGPVDFDQNGELIDTVTELDAPSAAETATETPEDTPLSPTATDAPTESPPTELPPTDTPAPAEPAAPAVPSEGFVEEARATQASASDAQSVAPAVAQAQSPLNTPSAAESPLATPSVNISPLDTPAQPASPLVVPQVQEIEADVAEGASYVRGRLLSSVTGEILPRSIVRLPKIICASADEEDTGDNAEADADDGELQAGTAADDGAEDDSSEVDPKSKGYTPPMPATATPARSVGEQGESSEASGDEEEAERDADDADEPQSASDEPAEAEAECFWALSDSLTAGAITDADGYFEFVDLAPGDYVFLVGDLVTVYAFALADVNTPFQFTAPADGAVDLGDVFVDYE